MGAFQRVELIAQTEAAECGLASLAMIANYWGHRIDLNTLRQEFSISLKGATLADLMQIADALSLDPRALRLDVEALGELKLPCILHWNLDHFVVLTSIGRSKVKVYDPAHGIIKISLLELSKHFSGVALELTPRKNFVHFHHSNRLTLLRLLAGVNGLRPFFFQIAVLAIVAQGLFLVVPFYLQMVIDEAVYGSRDSWPLFLVCGFVLMQIIAAAADAARARLGVAMGQSVSYQLSTALMRHLLRLPVSFFERRFTGEIYSRLASIRPIQEEITKSSAEIFSEIIISFVSILILFHYSTSLGVAVASLFFSYAIISILSIQHRLRLKHDFTIRSAEEQSHVLETIRASRSIKIYSKEYERLAFWQSRLVTTQNAEARLEIANSYIRTSKILADNLSLIAVAYLGAVEISKGRLTYGALIAVFIIRGFLFSRGTSLLDRISNFGLLQVYVDRLRDIAQAAVEPKPSGTLRPELIKAIILQDVWFGYGSSEVAVLAGISLKIAPNEFVAVVGPSGCGKSTFAKVLLGLYPPTKGTIIAADGSAGVSDPVSWRSLFGVVQQDDQLLAGTIIENIAFFDIQIDFERVVSAAKKAHVHDDVLSFPMGYRSIIGDMGSLMSEGQKQRLLLARALYKNPKILLMDEGTSDLDLLTERQVADVVERLEMTRIVIAHRPELVRRADRIFQLTDGRLFEIDWKAFDASN